MKAILILTAALALPAQADIIQKVGDSCPTGSYSVSGGYCKSFSSNSDEKTLANPSGGRCAVGWYKQGSYCRAYGKNAQGETVARVGDSCPRGFLPSGDFCRKR